MPFINPRPVFRHSLRALVMAGVMLNMLPVSAHPRSHNSQSGSGTTSSYGYGAPETTPLNPDLPPTEESSGAGHAENGGRTRQDQGAGADAGMEDEHLGTSEGAMEERQAELQARFAAEAQAADHSQKRRGPPLLQHGNWSCTVEAQVRVDCNTRTGQGNIRFIAARRDPEALMETPGKRPAQPTTNSPSGDVGLAVTLERGTHEEDGFFVSDPGASPPIGLRLSGGAGSTNGTFWKADLPRQVLDTDPARQRNARALLDALAGSSSARLVTAPTPAGGGVHPRPLVVDTRGAGFVREQILRLLDSPAPAGKPVGQ
ncbi:hypothetical protein E3E11_02960 [Oecophyllibacter saccharovorans]|uniref:hypothetical protein n=1 Tax=Oecophyllibacter saccharovorans TaxID=2558360 RepID=UPI001143C429|nr:hypothetical protein [Oecophyllibacter saccharovorans]QDH14997.1 hypothetical protein E3E11_02960 [Oecophyllibacter saccharovorans]